MTLPISVYCSCSTGPPFFDGWVSYLLQKVSLQLSHAVVLLSGSCKLQILQMFIEFSPFLFYETNGPSHPPPLSKCNPFHI